MILTGLPRNQIKNQNQWEHLLAEIRQQINFNDISLDLYFDLSNTYKLPLHLTYLIIEHLRKQKILTLEDLSSVSYYAICRDILTPYKNKGYTFLRHFNLQYPYLKNTDKRLEWFLNKENGLTLTQKIAILEEETSFNSMGIGKTRFEQALQNINLNATKEEIERRRLQEYDGIWASAVASFIEIERGDLTAAELLKLGDTLRQDTRTTIKMEVFISILKRMGKIEIYFLASQINKFHDLVSRTSSLLRAFSNVFNVEIKMLERLVAMHSMVDVAYLVENNELLEEFEKIIPFRTFRPMLAAKWQKNYKFPVIAEAKYDGIRLIVHKLGNRIECFSRRRKNYMYKFPALTGLSQTIPAFSIIIDGEITAYQWTMDGQKYLNVYELHDAIRNGFTNFRLVYVIFDIIYYNGVEILEIPFFKRKELRHQICEGIKKSMNVIGFEVREVESVIVKDMNNLVQIYNQYVNAGFEGAIVKDPNGKYELGKRSLLWQKLKPKETLDVTITGIIPIQGNTGVRVWGFRYAVKKEEGYEDLGMIRGIETAAGTRLAELIISRGLLTKSNKLVDLGEVIKAHSRFAQSGKSMGFEIEPEIVVTIDSLGIVRKDGKFILRNARFLHIREDKPVEEISTYYEIYNEYMRSE